MLTELAGTAQSQALPCLCESQQAYALPLPPLSQKSCIIHTGNAPWPPGSGGQRFCSSSFHETVPKRQFLAGYHLYGTTDSGLKYILLICEKGLLTCPEGRLQVCKISRGYRGVLREYRLGDTIFEFSFDLLQSPVPPRKELIYSFEAPNFVTVTEGTPPDHLVWKPEGLPLWSHGSIYFHTLEVIAWEYDI